MSRNEKQWRDALEGYWDNPSVRKNQEIEKYMDELDHEAIKKCAPSEWHDFLETYFRWKFTESRWLPDRLKDFESNSLEQLFRVKENLFAVDEFDLTEVQKGLKTVKSPQIRGLGYPGASGLLAVLFPKWFGTVDQMVVKALCEVESLPERQRVREMKPNNLKERDAILLIDIMRRKARQVNGWFGTNKWTSRKIDMILWASRDNASCSRSFLP
jgi:hypothetical protein